MVVQNRISVEMKPEELDEILTQVKVLNERMPYLVGLSSKERQRLNTAGDASMAFIRRCLDVAPLVEDYLPRGLDVDELRKDVELMDALQRVSVAVSQLHERLVDTRALASSEAYDGALEVYRAAKRARAREGMDDVVQELRQRFVNSPSGRDATDVEPEVETPAEEVASE